MTIFVNKDNNVVITGGDVVASTIAVPWVPARRYQDRGRAVDVGYHRHQDGGRAVERTSTSRFTPRICWASPTRWRQVHHRAGRGRRCAHQLCGRPPCRCGDDHRDVQLLVQFVDLSVPQATSVPVLVDDVTGDYPITFPAPIPLTQLALSCYAQPA